MEHYYYLHTNGSLIHKRLRPDLSDFVVRIWKLDVEDRESGWVLCVEALALGANKERIMELKKKWKLTDEDAQEFVKRDGGLILEKNDNGWCATFDDIANAECGYGPTALEALAELAKPGTTRKGK